MTPLPSTLTLSLSRLALYALAGVSLFLLWPRASNDAELREAQRLGEKAARSAIYHRQMATAAVDSLVAQKYRTDAVIKLANSRISAVSRTAFDSLPVSGAVSLQGTTLPIMGDPQPTDTLVPLRLARLKVREVADTANAVIASIEQAVMGERGRAANAIRHLEATILAQDTVIQSLTRQFKKSKVGVFTRAARGVEAAVVGATCSGLGWIAFGPPGLLLGLPCAALDGIRK